MNPVKIHFDKASSEYAKFSESGLWKVIRKKESRAITSLLPKITDSTLGLDLGCGAGFYSEVLHINKVKNISCVDFSENMLKQIKNTEFKKIRARIEDFRNEQKFDIIPCAGAMEFTEEPEKVFKNISYMLNREGCFILLWPVNNFLGYFYRFYHKRHGISVKLFTQQEIKNFGAAAGLKPVECSSVFPFTEITKFVHE